MEDVTLFVGLEDLLVLRFIVKQFNFAKSYAKLDKSMFDLTNLTVECYNLRDVSVGMKTKHFWRVCVVELVDELHVLGQFVTFGDSVALVEDKVGAEHRVTEPHLAERVEETFVEVVCHTAAILDFTKHVSNAHPCHTLKRKV